VPSVGTFTNFERALLLARCCEESNLIEVVNFDNFDKCHSPIEGAATYGGTTSPIERNRIIKCQSDTTYGYIQG
jgi:hypothetical protein